MGPGQSGGEDLERTSGKSHREVAHLRRRGKAPCRLSRVAPGDRPLCREHRLEAREILNLQWPLVDIFRKTLTLLVQKNRGKDTLPLNQKALDVLQKRIKVRQPGKNDFVFFNQNGNRLDASNLQRALRSAVKTAEIDKLRLQRGWFRQV